MSPTRRDFIKATGAAAATVAAGRHLGLELSAQTLPGPDPAAVDVATVALNAATSAGASYADVRIGRYRRQEIAGCARGILVTHFFYIRSLDPRTVLQTGLTRDGTFRIEQGKITRSLKNFRWNESPLLMLNRLEDIGRPEATAAGRMMPALRIRDFDFASLSDAV
jgi:predicted Zn-dependent protease